MAQSHRTVLIIDDCPEDRYTYRRYLLQDQSQAYTILEAESGQAALESCQKAQPDVILLDFLLPDLTGLELLVQLQSQLQEAPLPVILLTGQGSEAIAVQAMKAGAQDYLVKGRITPEDLRSTIHSVIEKNKLRIQLRESEERLKLALEAAQMGTWEWQIQTNTVIWSEQVAPIFGMPPGAMLPTYEAFLDAVYPDDRALISDAISRSLQEKHDYEVEFRARWADGTVRWVGGRGRIYCDAAQQPLRLVGTVMDITKSKQAEAERLQQVERERLIAQVAQQVHRSLDLNEVLQTTVDESRRFLQTDRVLIFQLNDKNEGTVVTESVGAEWIALLSTDFHDPCFAATYTERYQQGQVMAVPDVYNAGLQACHLELLTQLQVRANLVVPILQDQKLWGLLIAHHCAAPRSWQPIEIDLLKQLATQAGIALQQAELYQQAQRQLSERTLAETALRYQTDRERLVSQIAQRIRQTLSLTEVLNNTVAEVRHFLRCDRVFIYRFNPDYSGVIEVESVAEGWASVLAEVVEDTYFTQTQGEDYRQGRIQATEDIYTAGLTNCHVELLARFQVRANLAVPILQGETLWGLLVANQCGGVRSWQPLEIDLLKQLSNQVGIAIQQSEFHQRVRSELAERRRAEVALQTALQKLNFHVENSPLAVIEWNENFRVSRWSREAEKMFGWTAQEVLGKHPTEWKFVFTEDAAAIQSIIQQISTVPNRQTKSCNRNYAKDGSVLHCEWYNSSLTDADGNLVSVLSLVSNISDRIRLEQERDRILQQEQFAREQAETANRIKDEFLAVLSHELRTPLNPILGWSKILQSGRLDPIKTKEVLATIERNAKLQSQLIEDLLDVSCILRGKLALEASSVDLATIVQAALETVRLAAEAKQIDVEIALPEAVLWVTGDAGRLQQAAWNLLSNAVKFTPQQGRVEVRLERIDSMAQIQVIDNGKGISTEFLPHVFDYFRQEDGAITRQFGGLGLGLAIVRQIVELHGGSVAASSSGENQGSIFTVSLPLLKQADREQPDPNSSAPIFLDSSTSLAGLLVLVVDDDTDSREFVAFVLQQEGAEVMAVASAFDAMQALTRSKPNVVISDIGMPEIDGYEFIQQVRLWTPEQGGEIPAIALTAYAGEYDRNRAIQSGFQQHLSKPVDPIELVNSVARLSNCNR